MVVGNNHVYLIPGSVLAGATLLLLGDLLARVAIMPIILPTEDGLEVSVKGTATDALLTELLTESPADNGEFCKMTKYFSIFIKGKNMNFYSEHYGTELYITGASSDDISFFSKTIAPYEKQLSVCINQSS